MEKNQKNEKITAMATVTHTAYTNPNILIYFNI